MQQSVRTEENPALQLAAELAKERNLPLQIVFGLTENYPEANLRHYTFLVEGLVDVGRRLAERGLRLDVWAGSPDTVAVRAAAKARILVTDHGYTRIQRLWRHRAAEACVCPLLRVEGDVTVPVETASEKDEWAAATLRPKIHRLLPDFLEHHSSGEIPDVKSSPEPETGALLSEDLHHLLTTMQLDRSVSPSEAWRGGETTAEATLESFLNSRLQQYHELRSHPDRDHVSHLSPYLHFGHIAPLKIARRVHQTDAPSEAKSAFLEELIVRRELACNFVWFNRHYDTYDCLPEWALKTLAAHASDRREVIYTQRELEAAATHDPYWNAAQREMTDTGFMHNYMRMYWGKKILEWSASPREAFETALYLNNRYQLDGRDPNSFAGVAWCFGKHDRPWQERPIFGMVRYMNAGGLKRKFDIDAYVRRVMQHHSAAVSDGLFAH
jgi:deoxyribodipyrimidine photo-lyase